jgi:16S rRNA (uracil1498-N3)-methyltransferase
MAHLYYTEQDLSENTVSVTIEGDEARHAASVARLRVGESVAVSDGRGRIAQAVARDVAPGRVSFDVTDISEPEVFLPTLTLVQALAKGDRDELAVQMCTELGAAEIVPWQSERSIARWVGDKKAKGRVRWAAIAREASKQAMRSSIPSVADIVTTAELARMAGERTVIVLDPRAAVSLGDWARLHTNEREILVVIGPEGGISPNEIDALLAGGADAVHAGATVMRTSTAGAVGFSALRAIFGQL